MHLIRLMLYRGKSKFKGIGSHRRDVSLVAIPATYFASLRERETFVIVAANSHQKKKIRNCIVTPRLTIHVGLAMGITVTVLHGVLSDV